MAAIAEETDEERIAREDAEREARLAQEAAWAAAMENRIEDAPPAPPISYDIQDPPPAEALPFIEDAMASPEPTPSVGAETPFAQPSGIRERSSTGDYTTDSPQYAAEVARAQRGNGFLNADIGPAGNTIVGGYDPAIAEAAQRHAQARLASQAERFAGAQGYQQSLKSGATPAEALALWGSKMFRGDPKGLVNLATRREPVVRPVAHKPQWGKVPAQIADRIRSLDEDEKAQQSVLTRGTLTAGEFGLPLSDEQKSELKENMKRIRAEKQQILSDPAYNSNVDATGIDLNRWNNPPARPEVGVAASTKQAANTVIKYDKSGKGWVVDEQTKKVLRPAN